MAAAAAAAAAARVVETVAREARDQAAQHQALLQHRQDKERAQQSLAGLRVSYDSPEARTQRDTAREAAGVPAPAREVRAVSDMMNGTDPRTAAAAGTTPAAETAHARPKQPAREVTRSR